MIDVAIARIYNFASGVQKQRPLEDIPDKLSSIHPEHAHQRIFRKLIPPREDIII